MTNHAHLLLSPRRAESVPRLMIELGRRYVRSVNMTYRRTGTLWDSRHKSTVIRPPIGACGAGACPPDSDILRPKHYFAQGYPMSSIQPPLAGRIGVSFAHRLIQFMRVAILGFTPLLIEGCAGPNVNGFAPGSDDWPRGTVTTRDGKPFVLSGPGQDLRIMPGGLNMTPVTPAFLWNPHASPRPAEYLDITAGSTLRIKLHSGELNEKGLRIVGATHGLSANISGDWYDQLLSSDEYTTEQSCTKHCTRYVDKEVCDKGKCKTEQVSETYDCGTGTQTVRTRRNSCLCYVSCG